MGARDLNAAWKDWVRENIARRCDPNEMLAILLEHRFDIGSISACMGEHFPAGSPVLASADSRAAIFASLAHIPVQTLETHSGLWRFPSEEVQLFTLENFLSPADCDRLVSLIKRRLRPSTVTTGKPSDPYFRTSSTCDLSLMDDAFVATLDDRIGRTIGIRPSYAEGLQGQHYIPGQEFKAHTDFFEPGTPEYAKFGGERGNRTWTFMIYLNDVVRGGGTSFSKLGVHIQPRRGQAVIWNNNSADGTPNDRTLHAGLPVGEGEKVIVTKWFREHGAGPMFFQP